VTFAALAPELQSLVDEGQAAERAAQRRVARERYEEVLRRLDSRAHALVGATLIRWIGRTYIEDADLDAALDCCEAALAAASVNGDRSGVAHAINLKAIVFQRRGQLDDAERMYLDARERARGAHEPQLSAMIAQNLGTIANIRGELRMALKYYRSSLAQYRALGLHEYVGPLLTNVGLVYTDLRRWRSAERAYSEAIDWCRRHHDVTGQTIAEAGFAELWIARRRFGKAIEVCEAVLRLAEDSANTRAIGEVCKSYGVAMRETKNYDRAERYLARAQRIAEEREDLLLAAETAREQAELYRVQERNHETLHCLNRAHRIFSRMRARLDVADLDRRMELLEASYLAIVRRWGESIEAKDLYTQGHCERVADHACALARAVGIQEGTLLWFRMGALLHDVGKLVVPSEILNKPAALTAEEREVVKRHPVAGAELLADIDFPWDIRPMVRHHHERWDGTGYPDRLAGEQIPLAARILCIADVYDALTTDRGYRGAHSRENALLIMTAESGTTFDPSLFAQFEALLTRPPAANGEHAGVAPADGGRSTPFRRSGEQAAIALHPRRTADGAPAVRAMGAHIAAGRRVDDPGPKDGAARERPMKVLLVADRARDLGVVGAIEPGTTGGAFAAPQLAARVTDALRQLSVQRFDVVLLELAPHRNRGLDAVARLQEVAPDTPVIVIGGHADDDLAVRAVREGAQDYLVDGETDVPRLARVMRCAVERQAQQSTLRGMSLIDQLTGLYNRRGFFTLARQHEKLANRLRRRMLHIFIDLDGLKPINDSFGHREGDIALAEAAEVLRQTFRESDVVARIGGDEFAVLALETSRATGGLWQDRLTENIRRSNARRSRGYALEMSVGVAVYDPRHPVLIDDLMAQADSAMYEAKRRRKSALRERAAAEPPATELTAAQDARTGS
jgi:diguanylate cyclase (GGDEF)-like protein/putative nucleotidyltransferase with HDIG domain